VLSPVAPQFYIEQELAQIEEISQIHCQMVKHSTMKKEKKSKIMELCHHPQLCPITIFQSMAKCPPHLSHEYGKNFARFGDQRI
jgi:hypothetical protein